MSAITINNKKVLFSGQIALSSRQNEFTVEIQGEKLFKVRFENDGIGKSFGLPELTDDGIVVTLNNFGHPLGMTVNGSFARFGILSKPTAYTIVVHVIGDVEPTRLVALTLSEA
ncbi:hypothetical protein V9K92_10360 [Phyllobacterium sp. CCNWLW109]|uniref:hypothetical protein n=1 Tax=Phyllobacterium sp. CCNWLW109 TaxID=3127479 RepID=UPI00307850FE